MFASVAPSAATVRRAVAFKSSSPFPRAARNKKEDTRMGIRFFVCIRANILIETPKGVQIALFRGVHHFEKGVHFLYPGGCIPLKIHSKMYITIYSNSTLTHSFLSTTICAEPLLRYSTNPYLTLMRSSFSNMGSAATRMKLTVAAAWIRSMGRPDT